MKKLTIQILLILAVTICAGLPAHAQSKGSLVANIPFGFFVQQELVPAGQYVIDPLGQDHLKMFKIQSKDHRITILVHATPSYSRSNRRTEAKLVFAKYGTEYFLREAWIPSSDFGLHFAPSARELQVAKQLRQQEELVAVHRR